MQIHKISTITLIVTILGACSSQEHYFRQNEINKDINKLSTVETRSTNVTTKNAYPKERRNPLPSTLISAAAENNIIAPARLQSPKKAKTMAQPAPFRKSLRAAPNAMMKSFAVTSHSVVPHDINPYPLEPIDRENYQPQQNNPIHLVAQQPVSTFSIDVDTGSYSNVRRLLREGRLPRHDAVRVEELINYFSYDYPQAKNTKTPFSVTTELGPNPWNKNTHLLHIGIRGYDVSTENLPAANLVFLLDVSGSMNSPDKLPLLKNALMLLTNQLRAQDRVSIVVYAGASGTVLQPTAGNRKADIATALQRLSAGGSTNGAAGIQLAYQLARQSFMSNGINRVILATDGDFNVGTTNLQALKDLITKQRQTGITLTTLGFGRGNYNDALMEQLADIGNGNYAYIDSLLEAQKTLVDQMGATLMTIAKDVKIQIEFNPSVVQEYRLVGYENRKLKQEDFNNDKVDAGDIGAGHTVTAIYEISLVNGKGNRLDPLRYQTAQKQLTKSSKEELAFVKIRYKQPKGNSSTLISHAIHPESIKTSLNSTTKRYQFSASVAAFGQLLRSSNYTQDLNFEQVIKLAQASKGDDINGYRGEFINLVKLASSLQATNKISLR